MKPALIPIPMSLEVKEGSCDLSTGAKIRFDPAFESEAELLAEWLGDATGSGFSLEQGPAGSAARAIPGIVIKKIPGEDKSERYALEVGEDGISIEAAAGAGVARAAATLRELALSNGGVFDRLSVIDEPRFSWRGFHLDTARHFFPVEFLERMIDLAALHKLNSFHWHLTDDQAWRMDLASHPEVTRLGSTRLDGRYNVPIRIGGSYSKADMRRIVAFASKRHINVVPEIETPGHATALLASHPEFSCAGAREDGKPFEPEDRYGIFDDILCAGNDAVLDFLSSVVDEICDIFPGPFVHMGGDEAPKARWRSCPKCARRMLSLGLTDADGKPDSERLQAWFMERMASLLAARGKRMIGWDEVLEGGIDKSVIIMSWRGAGPGGIAARQGYDVVMCPQTKSCYLDHKQVDEAAEPGQLGVCTLEDSYRFDPLPDGIRPGSEEAARIRGGQANLWAELLYFGKNVEYMAFPRLCALSEVFWSPREARKFPDFLSRLETHGARLDRLGVLWRRPDLT